MSDDGKKARLKEVIKKVVAKLDEMTDEPDEKVVWDAALDLLECLVEMTRTRFDDMLVKPIIAGFRRRFDIKD